MICQHRYDEIAAAKAERINRIMINRAISHITEEAMVLNTPQTTKIEEYLTAKCTDKAIAEELLASKRLVKKLYYKLLEKARAKAINGASVTPEEVYRTIDEYLWVE
jgi:hypothetical protein